MQIVNYSDFRTHLKSNLDKVSLDKETVIVTRSNDKNVVVISLDEYNSLTETIHLMKSTKNSQRLQEAIDEFDLGRSHSHNLIEE